MKILLTGATGFIGSHVARQLVRDGHEVHAVVRPASNLWRVEDIKSSLHFIKADLLRDTVAIPVELCIHLAWYVEPGKYLDSPLNDQWVEASLQLARALRGARFVAAGTCFETIQPLSRYARAKARLLEALHEFDFAWTRFFYQYGPSEDSRRLVPYVINSLLDNRRCPLTPGEQVRDFLHVEDVAAAICAVARSQLTGAVNIGSGQPVTVRAIAEKIGQLTGKPQLLALGAEPYRPNDPMHVVADNSRLRSTGWSPRFDLESGLRQTIHWWKSRRLQTGN